MSTFDKEKQRIGAESLANLPIACTLTPEEFQARKRTHLIEAGKTLEERVEKPDGYAFRFPGEMFDELARIVAMERRCCSFLRFTLTSEPGNGSIEVRSCPRSPCPPLYGSRRRGVGPGRNPRCRPYLVDV